MSNTPQSLRDRARELARGRSPGPPPAKPAMATAPPAPRGVEVYYDLGQGKYWTRDNSGEWIRLDDSSVKRVLKFAGYSPTVPDNAMLSPLDKRMHELQMGAGVHFAGEIAGYEAGPTTICDAKILVTRGRRPITPKQGPCDAVRAFIGELLGEQQDYALAWLKSALASIKAGPPFRPGQLLAMAGPPGCGKSLFQSLITIIFGGRVAKPYRYLMGRSEFNREILAAEHLTIEDEAASTDMRARKHFGAQLKNLLVNGHQSLHAKNKDAITITPFTRVTLSLNEEPENLLVLPPLTDDLKDKVILLRAFRATFPYSPDDLAGRQAYWRQLVGELPAFLSFLASWRVPAKIKDQRYGVKAYQDPALVDDLQELSNEDRLLNLLHTLAEDNKLDLPWRGSATQLETLLTTKFPPMMIGALFPHPGSMGGLLARLKSRLPGSFSKVRGANNARVWEIHLTR